MVKFSLQELCAVMAIACHKQRPKTIIITQLEIHHTILIAFLFFLMSDHTDRLRSIEHQSSN